MWCLLSNYKGKSTIYLGCCSADPYPWKWDMFTHGKFDLLTMGQKYNVKSARTTMDKNRFVSRLVWFSWDIWCTYYKNCKNHGSQVCISMGMGIRIQREQHPFIRTPYLYVALAEHLNLTIDRIWLCEWAENIFMCQAHLV